MSCKSDIENLASAVQRYQNAKQDHEQQSGRKRGLEQKERKCLERERQLEERKERKLSGLEQYFQNECQEYLGLERKQDQKEHERQEQYWKTQGNGENFATSLHSDWVKIAGGAAIVFFFGIVAFGSEVFFSSSCLGTLGILGLMAGFPYAEKKKPFWPSFFMAFIVTVIIIEAAFLLFGQSLMLLLS